MSPNYALYKDQSSPGLALVDATDEHHSTAPRVSLSAPPSAVASLSGVLIASKCHCLGSWSDVQCPIDVSCVVVRNSVHCQCLGDFINPWEEVDTSNWGQMNSLAIALY